MEEKQKHQTTNERNKKQMHRAKQNTQHTDKNKCRKQEILKKRENENKRQNKYKKQKQIMQLIFLNFYFRDILEKN